MLLYFCILNPNKCFYNLQSSSIRTTFYLHSLLSVQSNRTTRSSDLITLQRPSVRSRLKVTSRFFIHHAPVLWNSLYPNNCGNLRRLHHSALLLILLLHLPCPRISFTLNSKLLSFNNPFLLILLSLLHQLLSVLWPLDLANCRLV